MLQDNNKGKYPISDRENEVIEWLSHGMAEKEIANKLSISCKTVNNHIGNIKKKLGASKNLEIFAYKICELEGIEFDIDLFRERGISAFINSGNEKGEIFVPINRNPS